MRTCILSMRAVSPVNLVSSSSSSLSSTRSRTAVLPPPSPDDLPSPSELLRPRSTKRASPHFEVDDVPTKKRATARTRQRAGSKAQDAVPVNNATNGGEDAIHVDAFTKKPKVAKKTTKKGAKNTASDDKAQGIIEGAKITKPRARAVAVDPLDLESAIPRRLDWTPPKTSAKLTVDLTEQTLEGGASLQSLIGSFGYASEPGTIPQAAQKEARKEAPLRKRKLEMIVAPAAASPILTAIKEKKKREKAPKKKAQTITELATREFVPIADALKPSLLEGFLTQLPSRDPDKDGDSKLAEAFEGSRGRNKSPVKGKKGTVPSRLLSPEKAIEAAESQELLFGTSSQLVREESPTFIRDLQFALRESETSASQQGAALLRDEASSANRSLWDAAQRNSDGELLEAAVIERVRTPKAQNTNQGANQGPLHATAALLSPAETATVTTPDPAAEQGLNLLAADGEPRISLPKSMAEAACRVRPRSKSPVKKKSRAKGSATKSVKKSDTDFNTWTVAELTKQIKSYGFKPVKTKSAMVALLEKCRTSMNDKTKQVLQPLEANSGSAPSRHATVDADKKKKKSPRKTTASADTAQAGEGSTPKKRGRPKKTAEDVAPTETLKAKPKKPMAKKSGLGSSLSALPDAILVTSSPPGASAAAKPDAAETSIPASATTRTAPAASGNGKTRAGVQVPDSDDDDEVEPDAAVDPNARLLVAITSAVTAFPPTHDPRNPSWHEKMLMYDPIVLEDLAVWLNTVGLARVGVDEEVWPTLVRQWCEQRSVCCLWKENLRGGKRSRY